MIYIMKIIELLVSRMVPIPTDQVIHHFSFINVKILLGLDKPRAAVPKSDTDIKLREKEAELARMQAMLLQMQQQLKQQNQAPSSSSSHNV